MLNKDLDPNKTESYSDYNQKDYAPTLMHNEALKSFSIEIKKITFFFISFSSSSFTSSGSSKLGRLLSKKIWRRRALYWRVRLLSKSISKSYLCCYDFLFRSTSR